MNLASIQFLPLRKITEKIGSGATPRGGKNSYKNDGIALIRSLNVHDITFKYKDLAYIDDQQASRLANVVVESGDVLLNITGASVARCCMTPDDILPARVNQHVAIIRIKKNQADADYVMYCLNTARYKNHLLAIAQGGATREALTKEKIENFEIPIPPLPIQRKITSILSTYDDLIENNLRRIKILEEMAQKLYREWFVKFRFPGHEKVKFVDSPLGKIPEGWKVGTIDELAVFENGDRGKNYPKSSEFVETGVPFVNAGHLAGNVVDPQHVNRITESVFSRLSRGKIVPSDMLFCVRGTLGRIARVGSLNRGAIASSLVIIRSEDLGGRSYLFYFLSGEQGQQLVKQLDNGAAQPNIAVQSLKCSRVLIPARHLLERFGTFIHPIWQAVESLHTKSGNLKKTRDLLLPRLISGKLDVSDLDIDIPEDTA